MAILLLIAVVASASEAFFLISVGRIALESVIASTESSNKIFVGLVPLSLFLSLGLRFYLNRLIANSLSRYLEEIREIVSRNIFRSLSGSDVRINASTISYQMGSISLGAVDRARDIFEGAVGGITLLSFGFAAVVTEPYASLIGFGLMVIALFILRFLKRKVSVTSAEKVMSDEVLASKIDGLFSLKDEIRAHGMQPEVAKWSSNIIRDSAIRWRDNDLMAKNIPLVYVAVMYSMLALISTAVALFPLMNVSSFAGISLVLLRAQNYGNRLQVGVLAVVQYRELVRNLNAMECKAEVRDPVTKGKVRLGRSSEPLEGSPNLSEASVVLGFQRVTFSYDGAVLHLPETNFTLSTGEVLGIVGPSGSGKTTIAKLSSGILIPTSGHVTISGTRSDLLRDPDRRKIINYLPQSPGRIVGTIEENISMFDDQIDKEAMNSAFLELGLLDELGDDSVLQEIGSSSSNISGGQMQRLMLCRWAVRKRPLSILDEPTSALDGLNTDVVGNLVRLMATNSAVLLITHSEKLLPFCDRVLDLDRE